MRPPPFHAALRSLRRPLVAWLVLAIVAYGPSSVLLQLLGPTHRHEAIAPTGLQSAIAGLADVFRGIREWRADLQAQWLGAQAPHAHADGRVHVHPAGSEGPHVRAGTHAHAHAAFLRHHHDPADPTVVALDGGVGTAADGASPASAGSATLPLALATRVLLAAPVVADTTWPPANGSAWVDAIPLPLERPPQA